MGGLGSTRWRGHEKATTVEQCLGLDLGTLKHEGALDGEAHVVGWRDAYSDELVCFGVVRRFLAPEPETLLVGIARPNEVQPQQEIELTSTRQHFGGERLWFKCDCGHRGYRLYLPPGAERFACTTCHQLTYRSAQEHDPRVDYYRRNPEELIRAAVFYPATPESRHAARALSIMLRLRAPIPFGGSSSEPLCGMAEVCDDAFAGILNASAS
jgi:hypothetical protein